MRYEYHGLSLIPHTSMQTRATARCQWLGMPPGRGVELTGMHSSLPQHWQHSRLSTCSPQRQLSMKKHNYKIWSRSCYSCRGKCFITKYSEIHGPTCWLLERTFDSIQYFNKPTIFTTKTSQSLKPELNVQCWNTALGVLWSSCWKECNLNFIRSHSTFLGCIWMLFL